MSTLSETAIGCLSFIKPRPLLQIRPPRRLRSVRDCQCPQPYELCSCWYESQFVNWELHKATVLQVAVVYSRTIGRRISYVQSSWVWDNLAFLVLRSGRPHCALWDG